MCVSAAAEAYVMGSDWETVPVAQLRKILEETACSPRHYQFGVNIFNDCPK